MKVKLKPWPFTGAAEAVVKQLRDDRMLPVQTDVSDKELVRNLAAVIRSAVDANAETSAWDSIQMHLKESGMEDEARLLEGLADSAFAVISNWSEGDLAGAVNSLEGSLDELGVKLDEEEEDVLRTYQADWHIKSTDDGSVIASGQMRMPAGNADEAAEKIDEQIRETRPEADLDDISVVVETPHVVDEDDEEEEEGGDGDDQPASESA